MNIQEEEVNLEELIGASNFTEFEKLTSSKLSIRSRETHQTSIMEDDALRLQLEGQTSLLSEKELEARGVLPCLSTWSSDTKTTYLGIPLLGVIEKKAERLRP